MKKKIPKTTSKSIGILSVEIWIYCIISIVFLLVMAPENGNGIGVFHQPDQNIIPPIIIGILINGALIYIISFVIVPYFLSTRQYIHLLLVIPSIFFATILIKTFIHVILIYFLYPTLQSYSFLVLSEENLYFVFPVGVLAVLYGLLRITFFSHVKMDIFSKRNAIITIPSGKKVFRFKISDILYASSEGNYVKIVTLNKSPLLYISLNNLEKILPNDLFMRIHRSHIVSLRQIERFDQKTVIINSQELIIGQKYQDSVKKRLLELGPEPDD